MLRGLRGDITVVSSAVNDKVGTQEEQTTVQQSGLMRTDQEVTILQRGSQNRHKSTYIYIVTIHKCISKYIKRGPELGSHHAERH